MMANGKEWSVMLKYEHIQPETLEITLHGLHRVSLVFGRKLDTHCQDKALSPHLGLPENEWGNVRFNGLMSGYLANNKG